MPLDEASSNTTGYLRSETGRNHLSPEEEEIQGWYEMHVEKRLRVQKKTYDTHDPWTSHTFSFTYGDGSLRSALCSARNRGGKRTGKRLSYSSFLRNP